MTGRLNVNVEPTPSSSMPSFSLLLVAHIFPPCVSIILFEINNPKPVPPVMDLVANFVKSFGNISGCYPLQNTDFPVSTVKALINEGESKAMKILQ